MEHKAYILRTCASDMTSHGGFKWPRSGMVEAPDWRDDKQCGHGLHGFLWGEGSGRLASWADDAVWIVAAVDQWTDLDGKVKFPRAEVVFTGGRKEATDHIISLGAGGPVIGASVQAGDWGTATAGDGGTATAGERGTATAGDWGTLIIKWHDGGRWRFAVGYVGEDGVKPNTPYRVVAGKLVEAV